MKADDLIAFLIEEAQHHVINDDRTTCIELALAAHGKKSEKRGQCHKGKKPERSTSGTTCKNCHRPNHTKENCWLKGGGKEGQGPKQNKFGRGKKKEESAIIAEEKDEEFFAFTCTSKLPKS